MQWNEAPRLIVLTQAHFGGSTGYWRFRVEPVAGGQTFEARGDELDCNRDRLDLWAVVRGLESLNEPSHLTLLTASRYVSRGFRFGLPQWRERDWCWESYGRWTAIRDADLWRRVDRALEFHEVDCRLWSWTPDPHTTARSTPRPSADASYGVWSGLWGRLRRFAALPLTAANAFAMSTL